VQDWSPEHNRLDNGPEFIATSWREWLAHLSTQKLYIAPASPWGRAVRPADHFILTKGGDNAFDRRSLNLVWVSPQNFTQQALSITIK